MKINPSIDPHSGATSSDSNVPSHSSAHAHKACYHGGAFFESIGEEFDRLERRLNVINADVLDAWFPPAPAVLEGLTDHLPWLLRTSPPVHAEGLIRAIAGARQLPASSILPGAGSSDLIFLALRSWLTTSSRVLLLDPTYGEYAHVCENVIGCRVDRFTLCRENGYRIDLGQLESHLNHGYDLIVLVNPNNPTGGHIPRDLLQSLLGRVPSHTLCWIDEAYVDYIGPDQSLERFAAARDNVVVCKSLSKAYGLSGARAAYLVACEGIIDALRPLVPPWRISLPAQVAAVYALQESDYYAERWRETRALQNMLAEGVRGIAADLEIIAGVGNYVLFHVPEELPEAAEIVGRCRTRDLFIRDAGGMGRGMGDRALRVAVKESDVQSRVLEILAWAIRG